MDNLGFFLEKHGLKPTLPDPIEVPKFPRTELASLFRELGFKVGVEIGVEQGFFSEILCKANPDLKLYSIDPWRTYTGYHDYLERDQQVMEERHQEAIVRLKPYNCEIIQKFSMDAVQDFQDESLDFVYIDGNHEIPWVLDDIYWWNTKVKKGGIIAGHDFYKSTRGLHSKCHVWFAVMCYTQAKCIHPWFLCGMKGEPVGAPPPAINRDRERSWFWFKS